MQTRKIDIGDGQDHKVCITNRALYELERLSGKTWSEFFKEFQSEDGEVEISITTINQLLCAALLGAKEDVDMDYVIDNVDPSKYMEMLPTLTAAMNDAMPSPKEGGEKKNSPKKSGGKSTKK